MSGAPGHELIRVVLRLDPRTEAISGKVQRGRRPAQPFYGWLELIGVLDAIHGERPRRLDRARASGSATEAPAAAS